MITPDLKDKILEYLVNNSPHMTYHGNTKEFSDAFGISDGVMNAILQQFHDKGLIEYRPYIGMRFSLDISANAHDYILKGGHLGEFEFLEMQAQKLKNDIFSFESTIPKDKLDSIKNTLNLILTAASTYSSYK